MSSPASIYIVSPRERWLVAQAAGSFITPALASEGFIHAATRDQVAGVLDRHFAGQSDLLLLEIETAPLGAALRYEASPRSGELFPHIFSAVPLAAVLTVEAIADAPWLATVGAAPAATGVAPTQALSGSTGTITC